MLADALGGAFLKPPPQFSASHMKLTQYFNESKQEMKKVVWPSKKETINYTLAVILISLGLAAFFAIVDYALNLGLEKIISK